MKYKIGPVTRLEGHLNVKTEIENNKIINAQAMGEMFRGVETILKGRDPLDAQQITQRICGVCPYAHAIASSYAQEAAYGIQPTKNGRILHNLVQGANHLYDYILHFYHLAALDFVDITAILSYQGRDRDLNGLKAWVQSEIKNNKISPAAPFLPRLSGEYIQNNDINIGAIKNYIKAMEIQAKANMAASIFGGKFPHSVSIFPGGCTQEVTIDKIINYQTIIKEVRSFIIDKYIPDLEAVALAFPNYWKMGKTEGLFMSFGLLPLGPETNSKRLFASGIVNGNNIEDVDYEKITEDVLYSKYSSASGLKLRNGSLIPEPNKSGAYSWTKAPRYNGQPVEVGPAARVLVDYKRKNNTKLVNLVDTYLNKLSLKVEDLNSVLGRHLSRGICSLIISDFLLEQSEKIEIGKPSIADIRIPKEGEGFGGTEASRGALLHYIRIKDYLIDKYELVVPTTWNVSPMDANGVHGPIETALIGTTVKKPEEQIESGRIIRSFDPCIACSVH